jgi:hypothetical protein
MHAQERISFSWSWVTRAKECCVLADRFQHPETRDKMLNVAVDFEVMALRATARELAQWRESGR